MRHSQNSIHNVSNPLSAITPAPAPDPQSPTLVAEDHQWYSPGPDDIQAASPDIWAASPDIQAASPPPPSPICGSLSSSSEDIPLSRHSAKGKKTSKAAGYSYN